MKIYQITVGPIQPERIPYIESVTGLAAARGIEYHMVEMPDVESKDPRDRTIAADIRRVEIAAAERDVLYVDTDIMLYDIPPLSKKVPTMVYYGGTPDTSMFYSPDRAFWIDIQKEVKRRNIQECYGFYRKVLRWKNAIEWPVEMYSHACMTLDEKID